MGSFAVYDCDQTIAAIASAPGGAARGIIRLSGPHVLEILKSCIRFGRLPAQWQAEIPTVHSGTLTVGTARTIDLPIDVYLWPGTRSYTRQPLAEIHTLGSPPLVSLALAAVCAAGARLAEPGEFTLRAFLAGRLDLPQAEAVLGVIDARGPRQYQQALAQLAGGLAKPLGTVRDRLLDLLADLEAGLDFVEEDIQFVSNADVARRLREAIESVEQLRAQLTTRHDHGELPRVVLMGLPNVGKSSLFNALAAGAEALVSDIPGTTRDYLCATLSDKGVRWQLIDTAGLDSRRSITSIEAAAEQSTRRQVAHSDVRVLCVDASRPTDAWETAEQAANSADELVVVFTKCDARRDALPFAGIETSAVALTGLDELRRTLAGRVARVDHAESALNMTAQRCEESLRSASEALRLALELNTLAAGEELVAAEIRLSLDELGKVVGKVYTDDVLDRVFSRFCIGK